MLTAEQFLEPIARHRGDEIVVATMSIVRPWARIAGSHLALASADSAMGHAADLALGIALAQPTRRVICLNGDGSMLMSLGTLASIIDTEVDNLLLFLAVNDSYEITGNQAVPGARRVDFAGIARAAGFPTAHDFRQPDPYAAAVPDLLRSPGPVLAAVHVEPGNEGPIRRGDHEPAAYLQESLFASARGLRDEICR